jgi:hypothetical protein
MALRACLYHKLDVCMHGCCAAACCMGVLLHAVALAVQINVFLLPERLSGFLLLSALLSLPTPAGPNVSTSIRFTCALHSEQYNSVHKHIMCT